MTNKKVTLSIDSKVYDQYKEFCEKNAIMLSKKVELFMKGELEHDDKEPGKEGKKPKEGAQ